MLLHVDGARLANAAASLGVSLRELTTDAGVDAVSFGGTKNGLVFGEAVVFCDPDLGDGFEFTRKQLGQLASKMRFISAQFEALLSRRPLAAKRLATRTRWPRGSRPPSPAIDGVEVVHPVEANGVFARLPRPAIDRLLRRARAAEHPSTCGTTPANVVRWMCSWDTTPEDVDTFAALWSQNR